MNITVVGLGYVGLSLAALFSKKHNVIALDINKARVDTVSYTHLTLPTNREV